MPPDLAISVLNNRRSEVSSLEDRYKTRINFVGDALIKDRSFRLVPTARRGKKRSGKDKDEAVRPSMITPMLEDQMKAAKEARALMKKSPDEVEREIYAITDGMAATSRDQGPSTTPKAEPAVSTPIEERIPSLWEDASTLRDLLFSTPSRSLVQTETSLASSPKAARTPSPRQRGRRRRRSTKR